MLLWHYSGEWFHAQGAYSPRRAHCGIMPLTFHHANRCYYRSFTKHTKEVVGNARAFSLHPGQSNVPQASRLHPGYCRRLACIPGN